jgi:segregation and condensation protein A
LFVSASSLPVEDEFRVRLDLFEGPLDLLLFLIRRNELQITELALREVTSQYLAFLKLFQALNILVAGEYLLHAATLIELKSEALVPRPPEAGDESEAPAESLLRRLRERAGLRELTERLSELQNASLRRWVREAPWRGAPRSIHLLVSLPELCYALAELLRAIRAGPPHQVTIGQWSVQEMMRRLANSLDLERRLSLTSLLQHSASQGERVALFLAALELVRAVRHVRILQPAMFEEISLTVEEP